MKRFWLVLLSLGLIMAFSASAFAVDVKFSGNYQLGGIYLNKTSVADVTGTDALSTAFFFQRLRLFTEFAIAPGVSFNTRADIMKRAWGAARSAPSPAQDDLSAGSAAENENIVFDYAYVHFDTPLGFLQAGYMLDNVWGTQFGDSESPTGCLFYGKGIDKLFIGLMFYKEAEFSYTAKVAATAADRDVDKYVAFVMYTERNWNAGFLYVFVRNAAARGINETTKLHIFVPYVKANIGPVALESEVAYTTGKAPEFEAGAGNDVTVSQWSAYVNAVATFGPFYVGGTFAYVEGDDLGTTDKLEGGVLDGGKDWNPCLILWNYDRSYWVGGLAGNGISTNGSPMSNAWFYQAKAGVKPMDKLDIMGSVSYATADKNPAANWVSKNYGWEVDVTGTYKITNNLSYLLGFGYLITGDYFKGANAANNVANDYLVINKLTLTF